MLAEKFAPKDKRKYIPSATGLGLGLILPFYYPLSMTIGAIAARVWEKKDKKSHDDFMVPTSAGIIAGVSIIGVIVAVLNVLMFAD